MTDKTALAASAPLCFLAFACFIFKQVIIPFPTGFFEMTDKFIIASVDALDIKSKWGVSPFITHPNAINASNFFLENSQTKYLNAILDNIGKKLRSTNA